MAELAPPAGGSSSAAEDQRGFFVFGAYGVSAPAGFLIDEVVSSRSGLPQRGIVSLLSNRRPGSLRSPGVSNASSPRPATLKEVKVPEDLKIVMTGETLFNDGVGVVLLAVLVDAALGDNLDALHVGRMFVVEAVGGAVLGAITGYVAYRAMRAIDDYSIEVLILLALVVGTYAIASRLGGERSAGRRRRGIAGWKQRAARCAKRSDPEVSLRFLDADRRNAELNPVPADRAGSSGAALRTCLRLANGAVGATGAHRPAGCCQRAYPAPRPVPQIRARNHSGADWGGLRGGISVALALSLPEVAEKPALLAATYAVVLFT